MLTPRWRGSKCFTDTGSCICLHVSAAIERHGSSLQLQLGFKQEFLCYYLHRCPMKHANCRPPRGHENEDASWEGGNGSNVHMISFTIPPAFPNGRCDGHDITLSGLKPLLERCTMMKFFFLTPPNHNLLPRLRRFLGLTGCCMPYPSLSGHRLTAWKIC